MVEIFQVSYTVFKIASERFPVYYYDHADGYIAGCGSDKFIYTAKITDSLDVDDFAATLLPTATEAEKEDDVLAYPTLSSRENVQSRYDIGDDVIYIGSAPADTADNETGWTIKRFELVDGLATDKKVTKVNQAIWSNRLFETYY